MKMPLLLAASSAFVSGCALWGEPLPDPECHTLAIDATSELLISADWLRHDPRAQNAGAGPFSFAGQLQALRAADARFNADVWWDIVGQSEPNDAADTPFRLLALVNRTDLSEQLSAQSPSGEARLAYTLTAEAGDAADSPAQPLTVIFEYSLGSAASARDWAAIFHDLAATPTELRASAAAVLVETFTAPPSSPQAPHLSQIRVNDARSGASRLYELALDENGRLAQRELSDTPRPCSDCHGSSSNAHGNFQLAEGADGAVTLSSFLTDEELPRRAQVMQARLCEQ